MALTRSVSNEIPLLKDDVIGALIHRPNRFRHRLKAKNWGEFRRSQSIKRYFPAIVAPRQATLTIRREPREDSV
jgi:hypothetical protein